MHALACLVAGLSVLGQAAAPPNDAPSKTEAELKAVLVPYYGRHAAEYEFFLDPRHEQKLQLHKQPVMTWTNVDKYMGAVFVWTYAGRPELIGCIGSRQRSTGDSVVFHEFHSLSRQPLEAVEFGGGQQTWKASRAGVTLADVAGAQPPADSERLRLIQMRNMARDFQGWMKDGDDVTELRLEPHPIFRYKAPERGVIDGAIFALVWKGTDPEVLLMLEDRQDGGDSRWQFALARFNYREMWVKRNDREVWRVGIARENDIYITGEVGIVTLDEVRQSAPQGTKQERTKQE